MEISDISQINTEEFASHYFCFNIDVSPNPVAKLYVLFIQFMLIFG